MEFTSHCMRPLAFAALEMYFHKRAGIRFLSLATMFVTQQMSCPTPVIFPWHGSGHMFVIGALCEVLFQNTIWTKTTKLEGAWERSFNCYGDQHV